MTKNKSKNKVTISAAHLPVETYLVYPRSIEIPKKNSLTTLFDRTPIDDYLSDCMVFLNMENALKFSRFVQNQSLFLKAYIPHMAIQGDSQGLKLKKGMVTKAHVHGCYPDINKSDLYVKNPHFDNKYYPLFQNSHNDELFPDD